MPSFPKKVSSTAIMLVTTCALSCASVIPANSTVEDNSVQGVVGPGQYQVALLIHPLEHNVEPDTMIEKVFSSAATSNVTRILSSAARECRAIEREYRASCAAAAYKRAARAANKPDYAPARRALSNASRKLSRLVSQNVDRAAPKKKGRSGTYKAVKKTAVKKVARQATKIITETQTKLLRSTGAAQRKTHYQRIAKAVGSTKVIFRS